MDQWLVRTAQNYIAGPYPKEQICQMILHGQLSFQDEVCLANGYWFYVHEREEVRKFLSIEVPKIKNSEEEITETHTLADDKTDTQTTYSNEPVQPNSTPVSPSRILPQENGTPKRPTGSTQQAVPQVEIMGEIDSSYFWKGLAWILVTAAALLVTALFFFLNVSKKN